MTPIEGPALIDPIELLQAHGITSSMSEPRHHCRCGLSFAVDLAGEDPYGPSAAHINDVTRAAGHAAAALLSAFRNKGKTIPGGFTEMLKEIAAEAD